ncbi:trimeric intracellular cation channel family protein [Corynebacterium phoceense]|uniref:trimeric intracellular cation channel family protein n=1 Tax=Corynebacterium phoceense TaxID=1686286 RepID=UPI00211C181B|nr:trimeric intracellular cation channel family protein [Corynebacterium phoceense]MCQ9332337.1 trimeric intracellular cation channel family protein [Corynebacterium phoceense]MCQ9341758.1 trimeric intracellular cation channel family protein [Corynebacterium phoceense]
MEQVDPEVMNFYRVFEFGGVFLMSILVSMVARRREFDIFGFFVIALVGSLGGGMMRDALIMAGAVSAMKDPMYLILATVGALIAFFTHLRGRVWELFQVHADALLLGIWAVAGATKALQYGLPPFSAVLMGVLTATGGGVLVDVMTGVTPQVLVGKRLYAMPALLSAVIVVVLNELGQTIWGMLLAPIPATALALLSYWRHWKIPFHVEFAPVNQAANFLRNAAAPLENESRRIARELEPYAMRSLRHQALAKADREIGNDVDDANPVEEAKEAVKDTAEAVKAVVEDDVETAADALTADDEAEVNREGGDGRA